VKSDIENRLAAVEDRLALIEERRRNLVPAALENNPNVQMVLQDSMKALTARLKQQAAANDWSKETARFNEAKARCARELEETVRAGQQHYAAEILAAIEFYERTGHSPTGYDIRESNVM
jgi:molecular chaperone GrpE (heat shock protein)